MKTVNWVKWCMTNAKRQALAMTVGSILVAVPHLCAGQAQSASARNLLLPTPSGADGDSAAPWISADGRFVLFSSSASDLIPADNNQLGVDVFLRDCASNTTALVSANFSGTGGGNGNSLAGQVSANGRYVSFQSDASDLLPGDTNGVSDIFVRDLQTALKHSGERGGGRQLGQRRLHRSGHDAGWPLCGVRERGNQLWWLAIRTKSRMCLCGMWSIAPHDWFPPAPAGLTSRRR